MFNFDRVALARNVHRILDFYNGEVDRWQRNKDQTQSIDSFVRYDDKAISWSRDLKKDLLRGQRTELEIDRVKRAIYRPFTVTYLYFDRILNEEVYSLPSIFPASVTHGDNRLLCLSGLGHDVFRCQVAAHIPEFKFSNAANGGTQCFPFYTYAEDGTHRRENITDLALEQFRSHYADPSITKWDIFHYVYAVLHHPDYRQRYAANLRRELPRIPFVGSCATLSTCHPEAPSFGAEGPMQSAGVTGAADESIDPSARKKRGPQDDNGEFRALVKAGQRLAEIHVHYEQQPEYPLTKVEKAGEKLDYRVTKMKLSKDKTSLIYNQFLTLSGIPPETYEYRLGNRSALEWIVDQYQVSTDKRSGITNDPNRDDDPTYILRLIGQVITVSLETVSLIRSLPPLGLPPDNA